MKLTRKSNAAPTVEKQTLGLSRRQFMKQAGIASGGIAAASFLGTGMMRRAEAKDIPHDAPTEIKRTVCSACAVGCGLYAEVQNGVWTGQEPAFDHPFNAGGHCAKGAALREHGHGEKRLKYPMKLVDGKWKKLSWEQAFNEVGDQMQNIRKESGPDSVYFMGSAKFSNEGCYMYRKFAAMWGTNNVDHSARICHSTTVAGVANTWGYGAQTNSFNDIQNANAIFFIGSNPAEAHPVAMQHILIAKEKNNAKIIVVDPRFSRTAAHADLHCGLRPGTDIPFIYGMLWHIFENGWEDKTFIQQRVFEMDTIREEVKKFPPKEVANITGCSEEEVYQAAKLMAENRPGTVVWCMGGTQHHVGNANTRAYCILQLALGNMGVSGGGTNIFRGHDNVQGATDLGLLFDTLPGYYGLKTGSWKHWCNVWDLDYNWVKGRFDQNSYLGRIPMNTPGIPCSRWHDGVLETPEKLAQKDRVRMAFFWGQSVNTETRQNDVRDALDKMDTVVVVDPFPTMAGVMHRRKNGVYLLPAATQFETQGSVSNSGRSQQWREQVIQPLFESKTDLEIMYRLSQKLGFADEYTKRIAKDANDLLVIEDVTREINRGMWTIGMSGQSPERLKLHTQNWGTFSNKTLEAAGGPAKGETYGLPWPCWGTPEQKHPGTQILYNTHKHVLEGGGNFRARYGVEYKGKNLLAEGSYSKGAEIQDGYPEFTADMLKQLGWWDDLTAAEKAEAEGKNWKTDISGGIQRVAMKHGCIPFGNAKARCIVWTFPDEVPVHREPLYTPRRDLVSKYPTYADMQVHRLPTLYKTIQDNDNTDKYPLGLTSGRLVEYEGGGEESRSNPWLAELQQEMFVEINPADAADRGIRDGDTVWLEGAEGGRIKIKAMVTPRVKPGVTWMPYHFAGEMHGESLAPNYPEGTVPYVIGESANTALTYGYDPVTQMQETKASLCQITKA
ncbi:MULTISPECIES: formate dehydrogenase subunit alpha [Shewanella]|uniref:Formate dehydrogenase subunit alpha n=1 Tax=Shewanella fidelis TaxID=173509 RepID=A0AAW8NU36_9GAMM|nr:MULTISPECIES: formate dehydrogenase subunit alpha [Shewanella]MDR8525746.1 formate dehydrogenase subunit alpha [Shewanella fidelis]MDW4812745.1 formate dehydrogenase subunit alpha [Shewanella fidelis]MDW4816493.1 formate dehydrogenase subunit alpha [Shewanella fidelis]MDW4820343.1 formate dehydrogenase subunit alpha [Shewanella fidelis]MDW4825209.1 formate dehydrogenase subunit alpha [Shewanella fidelis]